MNSYVLYTYLNLTRVFFSTICLTLSKIQKLYDAFAEENIEARVEYIYKEHRFVCYIHNIIHMLLPIYMYKLQTYSSSKVTEYIGNRGWPLKQVWKVAISITNSFAKQNVNIIINNYNIVILRFKFQRLKIIRASITILNLLLLTLLRFFIVCENNSERWRIIKVLK